jgi:hypothetical protein
MTCRCVCLREARCQGQITYEEENAGPSAAHSMNEGSYDVRQSGKGIYFLE